MRTVWSVSTADAGAAPYADRRAGPRPALPWWAWPLAAAAIFAAAVVGVLFVPRGSTVAVWWPAAALSVLLAMLQPPSRLPHVLAVVLVATSLANLAGGRDPLVCLAFGVANAAEVVVIALVLGLRRRRFELSSLRAGLRFAVAVVAGALAAGVIAAAIVVPLEGGGLWPTVVLVAASHAAAVSLLAPIAALPPPIPVQAGPVEMTVQIALLAAAVLLVFGSPSSLPLAFAPFPMLAWAALRFPIRFVLAETVVASLLMLAATLDGGGPFHGTGRDPLLGAAMFELLLVTFAGFAVVLSSAQYELRALARRLDATNRLLTGSVIDARIGLVVAERGEDAVVHWSNRAGRAMLADELSGDRWSGPLRAAAARALETGEQVTVTTDAGRIITVAANAVDDGGERMTVQLLDVTALLRARQAQVEAEVEREAARTIRAELERQRDDFLVTTSHELRTPITSIVGYAELLADGASLTPTERDWVRVIDRNAHRLAELVEDLLTLGRSGTGTARPLRRERLPCDELFEEIAANLRVESERKRLRLEREPQGLAVLGSRTDVSRMLSNLVVNACKFTPEGGTIRLSAHPLGESVQIRVADTGPGMSEPERSLAFDRFYRAPAAERDNVPGTGLGLAIVAELARRNGGAVSLRQGEPVGLVAELVLPAAGEAPPS